VKKTMTVAAVGLSAAIAAIAPAVATAKPDHAQHGHSAIAKQCAAEKKADKAAFKALYGKHAMRTCIKQEAPVSVKEFKNAAKECKAARAEDPDGFAETWGTKSRKNALGKCVSATAKADEPVNS
jgi:hypothetical protein